MTRRSTDGRQSEASKPDTVPKKKGQTSQKTSRKMSGETTKLVGKPPGAEAGICARPL